MTSTTAEPTGSADHGDSGTTLVGGLVLLVVCVLGVAALATVLYGFAYEMTERPEVTTTTTSGVIETADAPKGQSFTVSFDGAVQEGGPTEVTVIDPSGEIHSRMDLAPGVETVEIPEEQILFPSVEYESGEYEVVATHGNEVYGQATVQIESGPLLPHVPPGRLFGYGLVASVGLIAALFGGIARGD